MIFARHIARESVAEDDRILALVLTMYPPDRRVALVGEQHLRPAAHRPFAIPTWSGVALCAGALATLVLGQPQPPPRQPTSHQPTTHRHTARQPTAPQPAPRANARVTRERPAPHAAVAAAESAPPRPKPHARAPTRATPRHRKTATDGVQVRRNVAHPPRPGLARAQNDSRPARTHRVAARAISVAPAWQAPPQRAVEKASNQGEGDERAAQTKKARREQDARAAREAIRALRLR